MPSQAWFYECAKHLKIERFGTIFLQVQHYFQHSFYHTAVEHSIGKFSGGRQRSASSAIDLGESVFNLPFLQ
jgi:hypothetical protein